MRPPVRPARLLDGPAAAEPAFSRGGSGAPAASEAERAYRRGREEGLAEGRRLAEEEACGERAAGRARIAEAIAGLVAAAEAFQRDRERQVLAVALEAASRIVRARIEEGDPVAARATREAVEALPDSASVRVRVNQADLESVAAELREEIARGRLEIAADPSIERGGCVAESAVGSVDARLATAEHAVRLAARPGGEPA